MQRLLDEYVTLAFQIDRHFDGFIDAYIGSGDLRDAATEESLTPAQILPRLNALAEAIELSDLPDARMEYLRKQIRAMQVIGLKLAGDEIPYRAEVEGCFDISPEHVDETVFEAAIARLDEVLPGSGDVATRMRVWRTGTVIDQATARQAIDLILAETRRRTGLLLDLPDGERIDIEFVENQPWSGYNWYLGDARSRVDINTDLPLHLHELTGLIAHEAYPGHHTEHCLKDVGLLQENAQTEMSVQLINTPECVIHEGIAMLAESVIFPGDEGAKWKAEHLYPAVGVQSDIETESVVLGAALELRAVGGNAALLRHEQGADEATIVDYMTTYSLRTEEESKHRLQFIDDPLWRPYIFTYHVGRDLLGAWLHAAPEADRPEMFRDLLEHQHTPEMIRVSTR